MSGTVNPKAYDTLLDTLEDAMKECRALGLFRTAQRVHHALNEGRAERYEAQPNVPTITFTIGPVREQRS